MTLIQNGNVQVACKIGLLHVMIYVAASIITGELMFATLIY